MSTTRCEQCGLVNMVSSPSCRRCGAALGSSGAGPSVPGAPGMQGLSAGSRPLEEAGFDTDRGTGRAWGVVSLVLGAIGLMFFVVWPLRGAYAHEPRVTFSTTGVVISLIASTQGVFLLLFGERARKVLRGDGKVTVENAVLVVLFGAMCAVVCIAVYLWMTRTLNRLGYDV